MFLSVEKVEQYLALSRELGKDVPLMDVHVHPTEIIRNKHIYRSKVDKDCHLLSAVHTDYSKPELSRLRISFDQVDSSKFSRTLKNKLSEMLFSKNYNHIGIDVLHDQMRLAGVSHACMLPVASKLAPIETQMPFLGQLHEADNNLVVGYGLPKQEENVNVQELLREQLGKYPVKILKIHPNISGIDISQDEGKEYLEETLEICGILDLPVVIHGGISPILSGSENAYFARLENLSDIDWGLTKSSIILAHFGMYGCSANDISSAEEQCLVSIIDKHDNVFVDTSGVGFGVVNKMINVLPEEKVIFGSDALYMPIWESMSYLLHACDSNGFNKESYLKRVANENILKYFPGLFSL